MQKKICVDFDILNSGKFDIRRDGSLACAPFPGSMEWLSSLVEYKVLVYGKESDSFGGRRNIRVWLFESMLDLCLIDCKPGVSSWHNRVVEGMNTQLPWDVHIYKCVKKWVKNIGTPSKFPRCLYVSRNVCPLYGDYPSLGELSDAKG
jgi:hypothetical protein